MCTPLTLIQLILLAALMLSTNRWSLAGESAMRTVRFAETDALLANPAKGWMTMQRLPAREPRLPCSVAYFRLNWTDLEPAQGQYNWKLIDEAIEAWSKRNVRIAFRIMTTNAHSGGYYCSPKWLFDLGCKFHEYDRGGGDPTSGGKAIRRIEPDYADPLYLTTHRAFIEALARRYDGHSGVEFLDIGSYGIWGEWHTPNPKPWDTRKQILDMYLDAFKKTPLVCMSDDAEALAYCLARGTGFRRDGVGSQWHEQNWIGSKKYAAVKGFAEQWKRAPVVFEWFGTYQYIIGRQWSFDRAVEFMLKNHVTYINDNIGPVPPEHWPKIQQLARLAGYRFVLTEAAYPATAMLGQAIQIRLNWANVGVGKLYRKHSLVLYLLDEHGKVVSQQKPDGIDPRDWLPGEHKVLVSMPIPANLTKGPYTLGLALVDEQTQKPAIALACDAHHDARLYRIGRLRVE